MRLWIRRGRQLARPRRLVGVLLAGLTLVPAAKAAIGSFADGTFDDADWSHATVVYEPPGSNPSAAGVQVATGGNPDAYQRGDHEWTGAGLIVESHVATSAGTHDPGSEGTIQSVTGGLDAIVFSTVGGAGALNVALLIRQSGVVFRSPTLRVDLGQGWQPLSWGTLTAVDFTSTTGANPDFQATGAPIEVGYATSGGVSSAASNVWGIDNYAISLQVASPVPGLSGPALVGMVGSLLLLAGLYIASRSREGDGRSIEA